MRREKTRRSEKPACVFLPLSYFLKKIQRWQLCLLKYFAYIVHTPGVDCLIFKSEALFTLLMYFYFIKKQFH